MMLNDIRALQWAGNHYNDFQNFVLVERFVLESEDREEQKEALRIMCRDGMGIDATNVQLDGVLIQLMKSR